MALSDLGIKKLTPKMTRFECPDGKGLSLRVMPTGTKTWVFRYMIDGKARRMTFGQYPAVSLAEARKLHGAAMQEVERGIDPAAEKQEAKATRKTAPTVTELFQEFWEMELKKKVSGAEQKRFFFKDVYPSWGERKVSTITRRDAVLLVDIVRERAPVTANRVQSFLVRMFNFAAERGVVDYSPLAGLKKKPEKARQRVLSDEEIKLLWTALNLEDTTIDLYRVTKLALKMILLTGQRPGEVCGMTWSETSGDTWAIPATRMKGREAHTIPLSGMAQEILEDARAYSGDSRFVFRSSYKEDSPLTNRALAKAISRHWQEIGITEQFTPHDLRRTLRTRLAEIGIDDVVAERVMGHKLQGMLAIYNRHNYDTEKRQALNRWEKRLRQIVGIEDPHRGNILQFRRQEGV